MIALFLTAALAAYFLGPDLVSRFVLGFVCPRKNIVQSKGEEITRAVAWALIPLAIALVWARVYGTLAKCAGWNEWKIFFSGGYSNSYFDKNPDAVFHATKAVFWWNFAVLWRMYLIVCVFWVIVDLLIYYFGGIRRALKKGGRLRLGIRRFITFFILPRVSEWHAFLSSMLADEKDVRVQADILTKGNILYQGFVVDKFLGANGELNAIILAEPRRFRREEYTAAKTAAPPTRIDKEEYWTPIPGNTFIVIASEIASINLLHSSQSAVAKDAAVLDAIRSAVATLLESK